MRVLYNLMRGDLVIKSNVTDVAASKRIEAFLDTGVAEDVDFPPGVKAAAIVMNENSRDLVPLSSFEGAESAIECGAEKGVVDLRPFCYIDRE